MGDILKDSRFTKYLNDPRYRQIPKHERKVKIDKRFQSMFKDEKFKVKYTVDKRGRPVNETSTENLRKYYELESGESSEEDEEEDTDSEHSVKEDSTQGKFVRHPQLDSEDKQRTFTNDALVRGELDNKTKKKLYDLDIDYARGEGVLQTDSSSDEESSEVDEESDVEHEWGHLDGDADTTDESTKRIAICNMDWDNIKAVDIMVLLSSFIPPGGVICNVTIYPSEYGLERMREEELRGPIELTEQKEEKDNISVENEEGSTYHMEKLRRYQLNRLKYYYAVVECDSVATADKLYNECDGLEYESSATKLDLRFIPDNVTFDQEARESCSKLPDVSRYKPRLFTTTALQQVKVDLTWDATNPNRTEAIKSALDGKIDDLDLKEYLASSTDDESDNESITKEKTNRSDNNEEEDPILKYKNLLKDIQEKEVKKKNKDMEMEVTWGIGIRDKAEQLVKKRMKEGGTDLTPFEKILEKKREKKKQKKLERQKKIMENKNGSASDEDEGSISDAIPSDVDMNDPYFAEEFNKPEFKKIKSKISSKVPEEIDENEDKRKAELELLLDDENDGKAHFSLKKIQEAESTTKKSKRKKKLKEKMQMKQTDDFEVNVDDERFSALYNSHLYNIDPTDPNFKKTKNMDKIIKEKLKRRPVETTDDVTPKKTKEEVEMNVLVKNIKRKTKNVSK